MNQCWTPWGGAPPTPRLMWTGSKDRAQSTQQTDSSQGDFLVRVPSLLCLPLGGPGLCSVCAKAQGEAGMQVRLSPLTPAPSEELQPAPASATGGGGVPGERLQQVTRSQLMTWHQPRKSWCLLLSPPLLLPLHLPLPLHLTELTPFPCPNCAPVLAPDPAPALDLAPAITTALDPAPARAPVPSLTPVPSPTSARATAPSPAPGPTPDPSPARTPARDCAPDSAPTSASAPSPAPVPAPDTTPASCSCLGLYCCSCLWPSSCPRSCICHHC